MDLKKISADYLVMTSEQKNILVNLQVALLILLMKAVEKGIGRFIFRKKQAGRSTQLELVTVEKAGVLKDHKTSH